MKKLFVYCIVDVVSETILNVFSAISVDMAKRQFEQALEANKDKIYDIDDIVLMIPYLNDIYSSDDKNLFGYCVPETYEDLKKYYISYNEYIGDCGHPISKIKED